MSQSAPDRHHGQHPFIALAVVLIAAFMILLDVSIVNVAIPSIQRELHASFAQVQFVVAGYLLAYAVLLLTGGRLGDIVGRKLMFIIGVVGFTLASALCGASQSGDQIVLARVFQGLMAAMMYPQIFSIITVVIPEFVVGHWYENVLHNQSALQLKLAMLRREDTVVTSVPYHVDSASPDSRSTSR